MDKELWQVEPGLPDRWLTLRVPQGDVCCWQLSREMQLLVFRGNGRRNIFPLFSVMLTLASIFPGLAPESTLEERVMRRGRGERAPANEQENCVPVAFFLLPVAVCKLIRAQCIERTQIPGFHLCFCSHWLSDLELYLCGLLLSQLSNGGDKGSNHFLECRPNGCKSAFRSMKCCLCEDSSAKPPSLACYCHTCLPVYFTHSGLTHVFFFNSFSDLH